jgi:hypothetical protein
MQEPGGTTTLSLSHADGEEDVEEGVVDTESEAFESPSRIKPMQEPGGTTTLSLEQDEDVGGVPRRHISRMKSLQEPGGTTTLSLAHADGEEEINTAAKRHVTRSMSLQEPGVRTSMVVKCHDSESGATRRVVSRARSMQEPGGTTTLSLAHADGEEEEGAGPSSSMNLVGRIGGSMVEVSETESILSELSEDVDLNSSEHHMQQGNGDEAFSGAKSTEGSSVLSDIVPLSSMHDHEMSVRIEERIFNELSQSESFSHVVNSSFSNALNLLCTMNNIPVCSAESDDVEDVLAPCQFNSSDLTPLSCVMHGSTISAVSAQCLAIDHSFLLLTLREQKLLEHIDFVQAIFLLSDESDFLVNMAGKLVDTHIENNATMRFSSHHHVSIHSPSKSTSIGNSTTNNEHDLYADFDFNLFSSHSVSLAFASVQSASQLTNTVFFSQANIFVEESNHIINNGIGMDMSHAVSGNMSARERHFLGAFSVKGLERLTLSYEAPWPFNMIVSREYLALMAVVTRRILEIAQLTALSRHVWGNLRSCRLRERGAKLPAKRKYERAIHVSFCVIRQSFQAISNFTSDRIRLLHDNCRAGLATPLQSGGASARCGQGFERFAESIRGYIRLVQDV